MDKFPSVQRQAMNRFCGNERFPSQLKNQVMGETDIRPGDDPRRACTFLMSFSPGPKRNKILFSSLFRKEFTRPWQGMVYAIESVFARSLFTAAESVAMA